jgi:hypothetical protein
MAPPAPAVRARTPLRKFAGLAMIGATAVLGTGIVAACSDEPQRTEAAYCDRVRAELTSLAGPVVATGADVDALLDTYRSIETVAPAAVQPEWERVVEVLETVSTVVPSDPVSLAAANEAALAGQPAYSAIQLYTQRTCEVAIGTPPTPTNPVTATTLPPTTVADGEGG